MMLKYVYTFQAELLREGDSYVVLLYTWRCCSLAIPTVCNFKNSDSIQPGICGHLQDLHDTTLYTPL